MKCLSLFCTMSAGILLAGSAFADNIVSRTTNWGGSTSTICFGEEPINNPGGNSINNTQGSLIDINKPCYQISGNPTGEQLVRIVANLTTLRRTSADKRTFQTLNDLQVQIKNLNEKLDSQQAQLESRRRFFEDVLIKELQRRMDMWPVELLANREAYSALKEQITQDLREILSVDD